jgi:hypothetical protein
METVQTRTCEQCKRATPLPKVRLFPRSNGKQWLLCDICCEEQKTRTQPRISNIPQQAKPKNTSAATPSGRQALAANTATVTREKLRCSHCNYKFYANTREAGVTFKLRCPYCSKSDALVSA